MSELETKKGRNLTIHLVLQVLVILATISQFLHHNYYNVLLCVLTLALFNIPKIVDRRFNVKLPTALEAVILAFIFSAEILGEIHSFYTRIPHWDTMLHTMNGFLMAAIGFSLIDILNRDPRFHINLSPLFVAFVAFCFSMTVGVVWEFFEFGMDQLAHQDMQKDFIISTVRSVEINPSGLNDIITVPDIQQTVIHYMNGSTPATLVIEGGYLDVGIKDTMKDLIVNCIGAVVFSIIGVLYIKNRGKGKVAASFIPQMKTQEEIEADKMKRKNKK
ncbi:MAG: hypothetical protein IKL72_06340 [Firmicutes bacterium]|nr:hypothetical protein [Bacillota bacterium]